MWELSWRWRGPSRRQQRRARRSYARLSSRLERQAEARLRSLCNADGSADAPPRASEGASGPATRRAAETALAVAPAAEAERCDSAATSREKRVGAALLTAQLGVSLDSRVGGSARRGSASRRMLIPENSRGRGLRTLFLPHLAGATTVIVQDGYVRTQLERLRELAELARGAGVQRIEVVAKPWRPDELVDADDTARDPLHLLGESVGGIEWAWRTSTLHHDRQVQILCDGGGVTVDLGRGLDMYYAAQDVFEDQTNSDTLRARETVVWTRTWKSRPSAPAPTLKCRGTTATAQDFAARPMRKLRRLAQRLRELARLHCAGQTLDVQQRCALRRRPAVELALSWRRRPGSWSPSSFGEAWTCPVPWCRVANRPERLACVYASRGCPGLRDMERFCCLWNAALRLQHFWRCKLYRMRRSWQALATAEAATQAKWRRGPVALEERSIQTDGRGSSLVVTYDAWTQASAAQQLPLALSQDYGPLRKRARASTAETPEVIAAQNAWMAGAAGSAPTTDEVAFAFRSFPDLPPRQRVRARTQNSPSSPQPRVAMEVCLWCRAPLEAGQPHICGVAAAVQLRDSPASTLRGRRLDRPRAPLNLIAQPFAPELCGWCGAPLVTAEQHICGGAITEQSRDVEEDASDESI